jgi:hypothetical protein
MELKAMKCMKPNCEADVNYAPIRVTCESFRYYGTLYGEGEYLNLCNDHANELGPTLLYDYREFPTPVQS